MGIERPKLYSIFINETQLNVDAECGWWVDKSLRRLPFSSSLLRKGKNEMRICCDYKENHPGLEIIYLLGNFGIQIHGMNTAVTQAPAMLKLGDWTKQGLAFYSGSVSYRKMISTKTDCAQRLFIQVPKYCGIAVRIWVNGKSAGTIAWPPNLVDITDFVNENDSGKAELIIEIIGHRRNSHGPLHLRDKHPIFIAPESFETVNGDWSDDYQLVPCGLMEIPCLITKSVC